jgi:hypothetical protein
MKLRAVHLLLTVGEVTAFPGMKNLMVDLLKRQTAPPTVPEPLLGDLATDGATTLVGNLVLNCINGTGPCQTNQPKVRYFQKTT